MKYITINCPECQGKLNENVKQKSFSCNDDSCEFTATHKIIKESFAKGEVTINESDDETGAVSAEFVSSLMENGDAVDSKKEKDDESDSKPSSGGNKVPKDVEKEKDEENETVTEAIKTLFEGQELNEEFRTKTATVFRAAVQESVDVEKAKLQEAFTNQVNEVKAQYDAKLVEAKDELAEKLDKYLDYVVEQHLEQNKVAIETNLKVEAAEAVLNGMKSLFEENHLEVPEGKNLAEEYEKQLAEVNGKLNAAITTSVDLKAQLKERDKADVVSQVAEGLADTQVEKLQKLAESVKFSDKEQYKSELQTLRESFLGSGKGDKPEVKPAVVTEEKIEDDEGEGETPSVQREYTFTF